MFKAALLLLTLVVAVPATAADRKPALSKASMTPDQIAVYRVFLNSYSNGSNSKLYNLANRTFPLDLSDDKGKGGCLDGLVFDDSQHPDSTFHKFDPHVALPNVRFVDPDKQQEAVKENDPSRTIHRGKPVNDAVEAAFNSGILTLSEVAFDKTGDFAVMSFSFVCGGLCGHGETMVYERKNGNWVRAKRRCSSWIS